MLLLLLLLGHQPVYAEGIKGRWGQQTDRQTDGWTDLGMAASTPIYIRMYDRRCAHGLVVLHVGMFGVVEQLPVDGEGLVSVMDVEEALLKHEGCTVLVSIMHSNNEVGSIQPIPDIAKVCHRYGVLLHTDAAQSVGKVRRRRRRRPRPVGRVGGVAS